MSKLIVKVLWVFIAALMVVGSASIARADDDLIVVKVPFAFIVGDSRLPAGDYVVREISGDLSVVSIASSDGRQFACTLTIPVSSEESPAKPELVFEKFGGHYFLARVMLEDNAREIILTPARVERQLVAASARS
jgi:hypothetical protein